MQNLFNYKNMQPEFLIQSDDDAFYQLPQLLNHITPNPILLILDDVWLGSEYLPEKFKFDLPNYKILVTSRTAFPRFNKFTYHLKPLNDVDAMTLFRRSASLHDGSSYIPAEEDVKKVLCQLVTCIYLYICLRVRYIDDNTIYTCQNYVFIHTHTYKICLFFCFFFCPHNPTVSKILAKNYSRNLQTITEFIWLLWGIPTSPSSNWRLTVWAA